MIEKFCPKCKTKMVWTDKSLTEIAHYYCENCKLKLFDGLQIDSRYMFGIPDLKQADKDIHELKRLL